MSNNHPILFFDGVCNLCNAAVDYVIRHDRSGSIHFAPLQSEAAQSILTKHEADPTVLDTIYFAVDGRIYHKSKAALQIMILMGGWRSILGYVGQIIPTFLSDKVYDWVAHNRYRWYGKQETCRVPTEGERGRFL